MWKIKLMQSLQAKCIHGLLSRLDLYISYIRLRENRAESLLKDRLLSLDTECCLMGLGWGLSF